MQIATFIVVTAVLIMTCITKTHLKQLREEIRDLETVISRIYNLIKPQ